jgi:tetratricopeptide (TPR) repeat protein
VLADQAGRPQEALKYAEAARRAGAGDPSVLDTVGWVYYHNDKLTEAEAVLLEALRLDRDHLAARLHLGHVNFKLGRVAEAREAFREVLAAARKAKNTRYESQAQEALDQVGR